MNISLIEKFKLYLNTLGSEEEKEYNFDEISDYSLFTVCSDEFKDFIRLNVSADVYQSLLADGQIDNEEMTSLQISTDGMIETSDNLEELSKEYNDILETIENDNLQNNIESEKELGQLPVGEPTENLTEEPLPQQTNTELEEKREPKAEQKPIDNTTDPDAPHSIQDIIQMELPLDKKLEEIYKNETIIDLIDTDKDGKLSDDEKEAFVDFIKAKFGVEELDLRTLEKALVDIENGEFNLSEKIEDKLTNEKDKEVKVEEKPVEKTQQVQPQSQSKSSPVSGGGRVPSSSSRVSGSSGAPMMENVKKEASLDELKSQKTEKESELKNLQGEMSAVNDGSDPDVKAAQEDYDNKEKEYKKALENDSALDDVEFNGMPIKEAASENLDSISETQKNIDDTTNKLNDVDNNITSKNSEISSTKSTITALENALKSYEGADSEEDSKIQERKAAAQNALDEANRQLELQEKELGELETQKGELESSLGELKTNLEKLEDTKVQIDEIINQNASPKTKQALDAFNIAKETLESTKEQKTNEIQDKIDVKQSEIDELDKQIQIKEQESIQKEYQNSSVIDDMDLEFNLTDEQKKELEKVKSIYADNKDLYERIANQILADTGKEIPPEVICGIHYRESNCDFGTYLHNGDPLGSPTVHVPEGIYFESFEKAAVDAIEREIDGTYYGKCKELGVESDFSTMSSVLLFAERFNGFGYRNHGCQSLYVYEGTTEYTGGRYAGDGDWRPNEWPKYSRPGVASITKTLMEMS